MSSKKFYLITPDKEFNADSELVKNLQRVISGAGDYELVVEPSNPVALLHVAIGLLAGNASTDSPDLESEPESNVEETEATEQETNEVGGAMDETTDDQPDGGEFSFESLGQVSLDGELIEAFFDPSAKDSVLEPVAVGISGQRLDYMINESKFATYMPINEGVSMQIVEHRITVNNQSALATFRIQGTTTGSPRLVIGSDYKRLFA